MLDFSFKNACEIIIENSNEERIAHLLKKYGATKIMICHGNSSIRSGLLGRIEKQLKLKRINYILLGNIRANPSKSLALKAIEIAKKEKVDFVLAVGGGSVIDTAKCVAAGAVNKNIWAHYEVQGNAPIIKAISVGVVLTIPAAGSEGSEGTVIRDDKSGIKYFIQAPCLVPKFVFINPKNCFTLPKEQIAYGASDILAHMMERYFSPQQNVVVSDKLLTAAMQSVLEIAPNLQRDNQNYDLWAEFCLLGTLAHNSMLDMGRSMQDWATHTIENTLLSGIYDIAHGAGLAIIFPAWIKYVAKTKPAKILQWAKEVMGARGKNDAEIIENGVAKLEKFYKSLGLPLTLAQAGIKFDKPVQKMVAELFPQDIKLGAYGEIGTKDIAAILNFIK